MNECYAKKITQLFIHLHRLQGGPFGFCEIPPKDYIFHILIQLPKNNYINFLFIREARINSHYQKSRNN